MKSLKFIIYLTTLTLVIYTMMTQLAVPIPLIFLGFIPTSALLFYMIYRVLKDPHKTQKTFSDWYEDKEVR
ncbi:MAG: hypothetical protein Roseis2KO_44970 [Roseivirga sp.]